MYIAQEGRCAICKRHQSEFRRRLDVDHSHSTGKVRGLLCVACNRGIGFFEESAARLVAAVTYLGEK